MNPFLVKMTVSFGLLYRDSLFTTNIENRDNWRQFDENGLKSFIKVKNKNNAKFKELPLWWILSNYID